MRRLSSGHKKLRGISRLLRAVDKWAESFKGYFPENLRPDARYHNWKIPVPISLVEGVHAKRRVQANCAQRLIDACSHLIVVKPPSAKDFRATCVVCLPDMFTSEVCIYLDENYFQSHTQPATSKKAETKRIEGRSLAKE